MSFVEVLKTVKRPMIGSVYLQVRRNGMLIDVDSIENHPLKWIVAAYHDQEDGSRSCMLVPGDWMVDVNDDGLLLRSYEDFDLSEEFKNGEVWGMFVARCAYPVWVPSSWMEISLDLLNPSICSVSVDVAKRISKAVAIGTGIKYPPPPEPMYTNWMNIVRVRVEEIKQELEDQHFSLTG